MSSTTLPLSSLESPPGGTLPPDRERAIRELLESIVRDTLEPGQPERPPQPNGPRVQLRRTALATAIAVLLVAVSPVLVSMLRTDGDVAQAATPRFVGHELADGTSATDTLRDLSERTAAAPDADPVDGASTIRTERWSLAITVGEAPEAPGGAPAEGRAAESPAEGLAGGTSGAGSTSDGATDRVTSAVIPVLREVTRNPDDGTVRVLEVGGQPQFPNDAYERAWNENGQPGPSGRVLLDERMPASELSTVFPADLPTRAGELKALLATERPAVQDDAGELLRSVHDLRLERRLGPQVQAAALRMLADEPGVVSLGLTTDRANRQALAVAADSDTSGWQTRQILLLDPDDGEVLGYEEVLTEDVARIDVDAPAIIGYTLFR